MPAPILSYIGKKKHHITFHQNVFLAMSPGHHLLDHSAYPCKGENARTNFQKRNWLFIHQYNSLGRKPVSVPARKKWGETKQWKIFETPNKMKGDDFTAGSMIKMGWLQITSTADCPTKPKTLLRNEDTSKLTGIGLNQETLSTIWLVGYSSHLYWIEKEN